LIPLANCRLYSFIDTAYLHGRKAEDIARQLCDGGSDIIQLRAKGCPPTEIAQLAEAILPVTRAAGVSLAINDHLDVARTTGAEVCHLGQEDFFGKGFSRVSDLKAGTPDLLLGLSSHSPPQAERAVAAGADYLGVGPVYATPTKPEAKAATLEFVEWAAKHLHIPWFAIGGIKLENLDQVLAAGARRICVVSAILNAPSIVEACHQLKSRLPDI